MNETFTGADGGIRPCRSKSPGFAGPRHRRSERDVVSAEHYSRIVVAYLNELGDPPNELAVEKTWRIAGEVTFTNQNRNDIMTRSKLLSSRSLRFQIGGNFLSVR